MLPDRFWDKVTISNTHFYKETPCWEWTGYIQPDGYGRFWYGISQLVHRLSYEDIKGKIPEGLQINHMCRNRCCVNAEQHLEVLTQQENIKIGLSGFKRGIQQRLKTHCKQGHKFSKENTYIRSTGARTCKTCSRIRYQTRSNQE